MLPILFLLFLCGLLYLYLNHKQNYWKYRNVPHRKPNLILGNLYELIFKSKQPGKYFEKLYREFKGPYFGFYAYAKPWLIVTDPNLIKRILIQDYHVFRNRFVLCDETIDPIHSNGLFGVRSPTWKLLRTKLSPLYTSGKVKAMLHLMVKCGKNMTDFINTYEGKSVEVKEITAKYTTDVISSCAFGIEVNSHLNPNNEFRTAGKILFQNTFAATFPIACYFFAPILVKIFKFKFVNAKAASILRVALNDVIKHRENSKVKRNDLIDILIDLKNAETKKDEFKFDGDRLVAQAVTFFGAGHETTSSTIAFTLHELCINQQIQERLRLEVIATIEKYNELSYEAVQDMKYLHMIICETLRKYPLVSFISRECMEDYKVLETGLVIEKGTPIVIPQGGLHGDPKYFPNPEVYDPDRFNPDNKKTLTNYVYMPFGDGPRNCIGERFALLNAKLGIIQIIKNFHIERNNDTREPLKFGPSGLLQAIPGVFATFKKLSKT